MEEKKMETINNNKKKLLSGLISSAKFRYFIYFAFALTSALFHDLMNQDEMWNYNFASCIANGLLPYRDFNLLQTPFSCFLNSIPIFIFGHHLIVIRITGAILFAGIAIMCDKIGKELGRDGVILMIIPGAFLCMMFWNVFLEYSNTILFVVLAGIYYDLGTIHQKKRSIIGMLGMGALFGCAIMSKQTTGVFMTVAGYITSVVSAKMAGKSKREAGRMLLFRVLGSSIPCFIFLFYLLGTGTFGDFWDMCFNGIFTFSAKYSYFTYMDENIAYLLCGVAIPMILVSSLVIAVCYRGTEKGRMVLLLLIYSVFSLINMVPLANSFHVCIASIPIMLMLLELLPLKLLGHRIVRIIMGLVVLIMAVFMFIINPVTDIMDYEIILDVRGLEFTFNRSADIQNMKKIQQYIDEKNSEGTTVYILDNMAPVYFMPSNQYHKYLDMFLCGNIGTITPTEVLEQTEEGCIFLLPDDTRTNYQMPRQEEEEYMASLTKLGRICDFTIYQK